MLLNVFSITAILISILLLAIVLSVVSPSRRVWPPPAQKTWQYYFVWIPTLLSFLGIIVVGILDWNSLSWPPAVCWTAGISLVVIGNVLAWVGVYQISLLATSGAAKELVTNGLYQYTRNPQYLGDILILLGWSVWSASLWVIPLTAGGIVVFLLTPIAEEPWLEEAYGPPYAAYRQHVPRLLPIGGRFNSTRRSR